MKDRFLKFEGMDQRAAGVTFGTFHAVFFRIIRTYYKYTLDSLINEEHKYKVIQGIMKELKIETNDDDEFITDLLSEMSVYKNDLIELGYYNPLCCSKEDFQKIVYSYEEYKEVKGLLDFDDMLIKCYELLCSSPEILKHYQKRYQYILIDEFQDINRVQYEVIKMLAQPKNNIFIVGDDDQSIYYFRGARPEFLLQFPQDFAETQTVILNHNYRSTAHIIESANRVIFNNKIRHSKEMVTDREKGNEPILLNPEDFEEESLKVAEKIKEFYKKGVSYSQIAVVYRTNIQARALVDTFLDFRIPMYIRDQVKSIYDHWVVRDIESYLLAALSIEDKVSIQRIINRPKRYIGKDVLKSCMHLEKDLITSLLRSQQLRPWQMEKLEELRFLLTRLKNKKPEEAIHFIRKTIGYDEYILEYAKFKNMKPASFYDILSEVQEGAKHFQEIKAYLLHLNQVREEMNQQRKNKKPRESAVVLSTMHGVKGLEFDVVFIVGAVEGVIPHDKSMQPMELEEERRLFYVGVTRAKDSLFISSPKSRYAKETENSRFLEELLGLQKDKAYEFKVGETISHRQYGEGKIEKLEGTIGTIKFKKSFLNKRIDLSVCLKNNIIQVLGG